MPTCELSRPEVIPREPAIALVAVGGGRRDRRAVGGFGCHEILVRRAIACAVGQQGGIGLIGAGDGVREGIRLCGHAQP